jgi:hypothetical protein
LSDLLYTPEHWGAYVDSNNSGITVYTPGSYPYSVGFDNPGPSPNGTNDFSPSTTFTWYPGAVLEFDFYLIAGPVEDARPIVYELQKAQTATPFAPWGNLEAPLSGDTVSGTSGVVGGWVFALTPVKTVEILVDGSSAGVASYGSSRPDVASAFPGQSSNTGFQFALDTTKFANGTHSVNARITDAAGNIAILPTAQVTIVNPWTLARQAKLHNLRASTKAYAPFSTVRGYGVESTEVVDPENVEVLCPTVDAELTLVTCYPFSYIGAAPKRFIVHARQRNWSQPEPSSAFNRVETGILRPIRAIAHRPWKPI